MATVPPDNMTPNVPGQRTLSPEVLNAFQEWYASTMSAPPVSSSPGVSIAAGGRHLITAQPMPYKNFFGVVRDTGPNGTEDDYEDNRYWIESARVVNNADSIDAALNVEPLANSHFHHRIVTVTNLSEQESGSHSIPIDTVVNVQSLTDMTAPGRRRYYMQHTAPFGFKWAVVRLANTLDQVVYVQEAHSISPMSNLLTFREGDVAEPVLCVPGKLGRHYQHFVSNAPIWTAGLFTLPVIRTVGVWYCLHMPVLRMLPWPQGDYTLGTCQPTPDLED